MKHIGSLYWGHDEPANAWVINYTHHYFALGITTSPSTNGHFVGIIASDRVRKRSGNADEDYSKPCSGFIVQLGLWWIKFYLYVFTRGDGRA